MPAGYATFRWDSNNNICHLIDLTNLGDFSTQSMNFTTCTLERIDNALGGPLNTLYTCEIFFDSREGWLKISFPKNEERQEMMFRKIAGISHDPTQISENLNIKIPYAEYQMSPTQTRTIQGNLERVPTSDGELLWKMSTADFLD